MTDSSTDTTFQLNITEASVDLEFFSETLAAWAKVIKTSAESVESGDEYRIVVGELSSGSAHVVAAIHTSDPLFGKKIKASGDWAFQSIQRGTIADLPISMQQAAKSFQQVRAKRPDAPVSVSTDEADFLVPIVAPMSYAHQPTVSLGAIRGRIQSMSSRKGLRFTIWEELFDTAVHVFISADHYDALQSLWDQQAEVVGMITRDPQTGHPMSVRQVRSLRKISEPRTGDPLRFKGILREMVKPESIPVEVIRELRNG